MFANEEQQFEDDLQRMNASYEAFKVKALTNEVEIEELKHQEQNSETAKEELERELQIELAKVKDEAATWKGKYENTTSLWRISRAELRLRSLASRNESACSTSLSLASVTMGWIRGVLTMHSQIISIQNIQDCEESQKHS